MTGTELARQLAASIELVQEHPRPIIVPASKLPTDAELHAIHAQLARLAREGQPA